MGSSAVLVPQQKGDNCLFLCVSHRRGDLWVGCCTYLFPRQRVTWFSRTGRRARPRGSGRQQPNLRSFAPGVLRCVVLCILPTKNPSHLALALVLASAGCCCLNWVSGRSQHPGKKHEAEAHALRVVYSFLNVLLNRNSAFAMKPGHSSPANYSLLVGPFVTNQKLCTRVVKFFCSFHPRFLDRAELGTA